MRFAAHLIPEALRRLAARLPFAVRRVPVQEVVLAQRRVYILPTRQGVVYAGTLLLMLVASVNYGLALGYVLTFLLGAMGLNAMLHTYRNLANLRVIAGHAAPVFAGERAQFNVEIVNPRDHARHALLLGAPGTEPTVLEVPARETSNPGITIDAPARGILRPGRLTLATEYPLGLYRAWSHLDLDVHCLVYPRPAPPGLPPPAQACAQRIGISGGQGEEDFGGLRPYHPGDSLRHVAWKATAREDVLLTKQFSGNAVTECWLDWRELPPTLAVEERLSRLARWVIDAHAAGVGYGLKLPRLTLQIASGEAHRARCLEALALFRVQDA